MLPVSFPTQSIIFGDSHLVRFIVRATIVLSVLQIILTFATEYVATLTISVIALENIMTCRVHRSVILSLMADGEHHHDTPFALSTIISGTPMTLMEHAFDTKNQFERRSGRAEAMSDMS